MAKNPLHLKTSHDLNWPDIATMVVLLFMTLGFIAWGCWQLEHSEIAKAKLTQESSVRW